MTRDARSLRRRFAVLLVLSWAPPAWARAELNASASAGTGVMLSDDQQDALGFDRSALVGAAHLAKDVQRWLSLLAGLRYGAFFARDQQRTGQLLAPELGIELARPLENARPFIELDLGVGFTGKLVRPALNAAVGVDFAAGPRARLGPLVSYGRVFQWNEPTLTTDAGYLTFGLVLRVNLERRRPPMTKPAVRASQALPVVEAPPPAPVVDEGELLTLIERAVPMRTSRTELIAPVLFPFGEDAPSAQGIAMLHEVRRVLAEHLEFELVQIEGYADARGSAELNRALSRRRAENVQRFLVAHGIAAERLTLAGHGAENFVEDGDAAQAHAQNRRVVFRVLRVRTP